MKKIISFLALVVCGVIAFLYLGKDTISTTQSTKQEPQQSDKVNQELLPEQTPVQNSKIPSPPPPAHRQYNPPPAVPDEKPIAGERKTNPEPAPETEEENSEEPLSYPIEDAEIYFVPPEQRYPGNLGGPPPLNIPDQEFPEQ